MVLRQKHDAPPPKIVFLQAFSDTGAYPYMRMAQGGVKAVTHALSAAPPSQRILGHPVCHARALAWARALAADFCHVALFDVAGTQATCIALHGFDAAPRRLQISLVEPTPLRWTLEAAAPLIGAGRAPGGSCLARHLGLCIPRAFAVLPFLFQGRLVGLAYVDHAEAALPVPVLGRHLAADAPLVPSPPPPPQTHRLARRRGHRRPHIPAPRLQRTPGAAQAFAPEVAVEVKTEVAPTLAAPAPAPLPPSAATPVVEIPCQLPAALPAPAAPTRLQPRRRRLPRGWWLGPVALAVAMLAVLRPPGDAAAASQEFTVAPATPLAGIARQLASAGLVRSAPAFSAVARLAAYKRSLRAGTYGLKASMWPWELAAILQRGQVLTDRITLPEGLTLAQTAALLEHRGLAAAADVLAAARAPQLLQRHAIDGESAEGFLFPDTYEFARHSPASAIVEAMVQHFFDRLATLPEAAELSSEAIYDKVILASLIERETFAPSERQRVAGVFVNRLEADMRLESCASVQYLLPAPKPRLSREDTRLPSPYNTYLHGGLPPGPIASPGLAALQAAFRPEEHDLYYFVSREDGTHQHQFSRTLGEHLAAQRLIQRR